MTRLKTALTAVTGLVRPAPAVPPPPFVKCAGCGKGGRDDQSVPDPGQFTKIIGTAKIADPDNAPEPVKETAIQFIDAAPVHCSCGRWFHAIGCYGEHRHD